MPVKARYCSQCGAAVRTELVDDRPRDVCTGCGAVFYVNPLPVAASVVLNTNREVLLIRRRNEPYRGEWCLPMGFAELGETIMEAARRELKEEAGIEAKPLMLLDADSVESDHYGELLIVTFEMTKTGGTEEAGDDAEAIAYFPLDAVPPLAFSSNETALQVCVEAHRDQWAIQDSFRELQAQAGHEMLSDALVALVRDEAEAVARGWVEDVQDNPTTAPYRDLDPDELFQDAFTALSHFADWLIANEVDDDMRTFYTVLGRRRRAQGFAQHEILSGLTLLRKHIWTHSRNQGVWERPIDVYRVLELNRRIVLFFDKALYHTALGFEEASDDART